MRQYGEVTFVRPPVMLAAWPGMGNVGLMVVDYIRRKLEARPMGDIDMSAYFVPDSIVVKEGIAQFPEIPTSIFYYTTDPALIIFESNGQVGGRDGISVVREILDVAARFQVPRVFTSAAFAQGMSFKTPSQVLGTCNNQALLEKLTEYGVVSMPEGVIAGLNGLLLGIAGTRNIAAACLLGTIPQYAMNISYPKASLEIIKSFRKLLGMDIDLADLERSVEAMDRQLAQIEERIRQFFPSVSKEQKDEEISNIEEEKVPHFIMEKIERLFQEAARDRVKAPKLKEELDRWNLFELYENRFLDLFEDKKDDDDKGKKEKE